MRALTVSCGALLLASAAAPSDTRPTDWSWLTPVVAPAAPSSGNAEVLTLPGSPRRYSADAFHDLLAAPDWYPAEHPPMPKIVAHGHGEAYACGFCHLPDGNGRPENATLAGLPADYIRAQLQHFADGSRQSAVAAALPPRMMTAVARAVSPEEIDEAAAYFSRLRYRSHVRVVETDALAYAPARFVYVRASGPSRPIAGRVIEVPDDVGRFEARDPHLGTIAYVAPGTVSAGRAIARSGGPAGQPCATCHGETLRGGVAPPLAGRSPTMLLRQLAAFKLGTRANPEAAPMRAIAGQLRDDELVAVAALAATLKP